MKKLQIMAGMLSVLLLAGCGGAGASAKTTEGDPPQVASAAASGTTAAQNGNENPSEVVTQDEAERPGPVDAEPSGEKKTTSSAGETKPKAEDPPVQVLPAETVPPEAPPTESDPSKPVTDETAPQPEEKGFDIDYWLAYAKDCAVSIGLVLDQGTAGTWDMPVIPPALRIDSKRRRRLQEKRMALGHKRDDHEDERLHHVNDNTM